MIEVVSCLGKKDAYKILKVLYKLKRGRYSEIERELVKSGIYITPPTLSNRLKEFIKAGILVKVLDEEGNDVYVLTPFGEELIKALIELEEKYNKLRRKDNSATLSTSRV